jgi:hypothetical protein
MRSYFISLSLTLLLALQVNNLSSQPSLIQQQDCQTKEEASRQAQEAKEKAFKPARELLLRERVPFDPDVLKDLDWRRKLKTTLYGMWEMHRACRLGSQLKGLLLADVLYLPEKIELVDDTVIIANMIIFEGRNIVIKGNHSFASYPIEGQGVLGTTLPEAMLKQGYTEEDPKFGCDAFNQSAGKRFVPSFIDDFTVTVDTSAKSPSR